jgi:hypothetical protein
VSLKDEKTVPCVNLDKLYEAYENGVDLQKIVDCAVDMITTPVPELNIREYADYENVKDKLFIRVSNYEKNTEMLAGMPHEKVEDMAITYHVLVSEIKGGIGSIPITNDVMSLYGISQEQLHEDAVRNSMEIMPVRITDMASMMRETLRADMLQVGANEENLDEMVESFVPDTNMYVINNESGVGGASAIFYPGVMDEVAKVMQGDFFVIPSSTDEMLAIPDDGDADISELNAMVVQVNETQVEENMRLGNEVYHYAADEQVFEKASAFVERMAERSGKQEKGSVIDKINEKKKEAVEAVKDSITPKKTPELAM